MLIIMLIGNQLHSSLSQLSRQSLLLLTDLPSMLTVLEEDYQLKYSENWRGNPDDLKKIVLIGNQLHSSLSQLSRQSLLLLTDLPSMLTVLEEDYQLKKTMKVTLVMSMVSPPLRDINTVWA